MRAMCVAMAALAVACGGGDPGTVDGGEEGENTAPVLATLDPLELDEGQTRTVLLAASDPEGDAVSFFLQAPPPFATLSGAALTLAPDHSHAGTYALVVRVSDGQLSSQGVLSITVRDVNRPPALTPLSDRTLFAGETLEIPLSVVDPDGDRVTLSLQEAPTWAALVGSVLTLAPPALTSSVQTLTVTATDDGAPALSVSVSFQVTVELPVNRAPVLSDLRQVDGANLAIAAGATVGALPTLRVQVDEPDQTPVQLEAEVVPVGSPFSQTPTHSTALGPEGEISLPLNSLGPGTYKWQVRARDEEGLASLWLAFNDGGAAFDYAPVGLYGTVAINGGAAYANSLTVTLNLQAQGPAPISQMRFSQNAGASWTAYEPYAATRPGFILSGSSAGPRTVTVMFEDQAQQTTTASDTIVYDATPPTISGFSVQNGAYAIPTPTVTLTFTATDATSGVALHQARTGSAGDFTEITAPFTWTLPNQEGTHTVYLKVTDNAGNSATVSDQVVLDLGDPTHSASEVNGGAAYTNSTTVSVRALDAWDGPSGTGVVRLCISGSGALPSPQCGSNSSTAGTPMTLTPGEGLKSFGVYVEDRAGRTSTPTPSSITLDQTPPTLTSLSLNGGATASTSLQLSVTAVASDDRQLAALELSLDGTSFTSHPWEASVAYTLPAGPPGPRTIAARVVDAAGNVSAPPYAQASITIDDVPPQAQLDVASGRRATNQATVQLTITPSESTTGLLQHVQVQAAHLPPPASPGAFTAFSSPLPVTLSAGGEGEKAIYVWLQDLAGNVSPYPAGYAIAYDVTPPAVVSSTPGPGATAAARSTRPLLVFSEPLDEATVTAANITLSGSAGTLTYDPSQRSVTFSPFVPLPADAAVTVTVSTAVKDLAGNALPAPYSFAFDTGNTVNLAAKTAPAHQDLRREKNAKGTMLVWRQFNGHSGVLTWAHRSGAGWKTGVLGAGSFAATYQGPPAGELITWGDRFVAVFNDGMTRRWAIFENGTWTFPAAAAPPLRVGSDGTRLMSVYPASSQLLASFYDGVGWTTPAVLAPSAASNPSVAGGEGGFIVGWASYLGSSTNALNYSMKVRRFHGTAWQPEEAVRNVSTATWSSAPSWPGLVHNGESWIGVHLAGGVATAEVKDPTTGAWAPLALGNGSSAVYLERVGGQVVLLRSGNGTLSARVHDGTRWLAGAGALDASASGVALATTSTAYVVANAVAGVVRAYVFSVATNSWSPYAQLTAAGSPNHTSLASDGAAFTLTYIAGDAVHGAVYGAGGWSTPQQLSTGRLNGLSYAVATSTSSEVVFSEGAPLHSRVMQAGTFAAPVEVAPAHFGGSVAISNLTYNNAPRTWIASTPGGKTLATWRQYDAGRYNAYAAAYDGTSWGAPFLVGEDASAQEVTTNGAVFVLAYSKQGGGGVTRGYLRSWTPGGGLTLEQTLATSTREEGPLQIASDGTGFLAVWPRGTSQYNWFEVHYATSLDGQTWTPGAMVEPAMNTYTTPWWRLSLAGSSAGYVMLAGKSNSTDPLHARLFTGGAWSSPHPLSGSCAAAAGAAFGVVCTTSGLHTAHLNSLGTWTQSALNAAALPGPASIAAGASTLRVTYGDETRTWTNGSWTTPQVVPGLSASAMASDGTGFLALGVLPAAGVASLHSWRSAGGLLADNGLLEQAKGPVEHPVLSHDGAGYMTLWVQLDSAGLLKEVLVRRQ